MRDIRMRRHLCVTSASLVALTCLGDIASGQSIIPAISPATMPRIATVDERFQSYNVEMIEVTGGRFWKPYALPRSSEKPAQSGSDAPAGPAPDLCAYRPPIDLTNARLRRLAAALAPAYVRVSGTWANTTYFADTENAPSAPLAGFKGVLTRVQWRGVIDFARAVDAQIVTSFAISSGVRDAAGIWTPDQARRFLAYTRSIGGRIAAAEFMNEPNLPELGGAPAGYDAAAYGRDFRLFHSFAKRTTPEMMILGPGTTGETPAASDLVAASNAPVDALSYHHYGTLSERCIGTSTPETALSEQWLSRTEQSFKFYRGLRDQYAPGKPIWLTETADAACGGNRLATTFLDTFRYLDQLGRLAKAGVQVVMHNTLAASDYGLLDETTLTPRPNYWGALLWRRLMGSTVLDAALPIQAGFYIYAHCQRDTPGGVTLLAINTDREAPRSLSLPSAAERYTLDAANLQDRAVRLNSRTLALSANDEPPRITGTATAAGAVTFAPTTITFLAMPAAGNAACR